MVFELPRLNFRKRCVDRLKSPFEDSDFRSEGVPSRLRNKNPRFTIPKSQFLIPHSPLIPGPPFISLPIVEHHLGMLVHGLTPILNVSNIVESFAWFEKMGWQKGWDWGNPPTFGGVCNGKSEIFLCQGGQGSRGGPLPRHVCDDDTGGVWMSWWLGSPQKSIPLISVRWNTS